jgi:hypothetical protein
MRYNTGSSLLNPGCKQNIAKNLNPKTYQLEKVVINQLVHKFLYIYEARRFTSMSTGACHWNLLSSAGVTAVTYKTGVWIRFIAPYTFTQFWTTGNYSAIAILHTSQFTVTPFSVSTSRILTTDL